MERQIGDAEDWHAGAERLWLYNLHYFEDLIAEDSGSRSGWQRVLIDRWMRENPPGSRPGWEPYPISLRSVNWIKASLAGFVLSAAALDSLATQLRWLASSLEWHLLANHLFVNAKALFFGGLFFGGDEANAWRDLGALVLARELEEQILPDGGHFERSPMYHALTLEDVLDLLNLMRAYPARVGEHVRLRSALRDAAARMLLWLEAMSHPDGDLAFFNDAALGIALRPHDLRRYAQALGIEPPSKASGSRDLPQSGYARLQAGSWCSLVDAAPIGPDYQPGHAHADTLAFEVSFGEERVICNSGTSTYEIGEQRGFERSTRAHNTVEIDGENSSEVWAAFRVARRARPLDRQVMLTAAHLALTCAHDGYRRLPGSPVHRRTLELNPGGLTWIDNVEGARTHDVRGYIPLHPTIRTELAGEHVYLLTPNGARLKLSIEGAALACSDGTYAPEFGRLEKRRVLVWERSGALPVQVTLRLVPAG